ncbi:MAG: DUF790 family protein [SAR324 cluster bacterium]|nr:DUF790 family protein [SAR324 cluster bacterium]
MSTSVEDNTVLTKDLLNYRIYKNRITSRFVDPRDVQLLDWAERLLELFAQNIGETREALESDMEMIAGEFRGHGMVARGLQKLLMDRTEFETGTNTELLEWRKKVFSHTSQMLSRKDEFSLEEYQQQVARAFDQTPEQLAESLYQDLPPCQKMLEFKKISPEGLLHRYNCAQVQGLLFYCDKLKLSLPDSGTADMRQLFKYLRFHQLLATISREENTWVIEIDGPLSLFMQTQKYGQNLAWFFPAVLHQQAWSLSAEISIKKGKPAQLTLDQNCGIKSHYHQFLSYVPEDIALLEQTLEKSLPQWKIEPAVNFVPLSGSHYCFPDYTLTHSTKQQVALELFHAWHASPLTQRLRQLELSASAPLILGVAKKLLKEPAIAEIVERSDYFKKYGFLFREMPTPDKLRPVLENWQSNVFGQK